MQPCAEQLECQAVILLSRIISKNAEMTFRQGVRLLSLLVSASQIENIRKLDIRERTQK